MSSILRYFSYSCTFCWLFWIFSSNHKIRLIFFTHLEKASKTLVGFFLNWEMKKSDSTGLFRHFYFCNILLSQFCVVCSHCLLLRLVEVHNLMNLLQKLFWIFWNLFDQNIFAYFIPRINLGWQIIDAKKTLGRVLLQKVTDLFRDLIEKLILIVKHFSIGFRFSLN